MKDVVDMNERNKEEKVTVFGIPIMFTHKTVHANDPHKELLHWHNGVELAGVRKGSIQCRVDESVFLLKEGDFCFINAGSLHRMYCGKDAAGELDVITFSPEVLSGNSALYEEYVAPILEAKDFSHVCIERDSLYGYQIADLFDVLCRTIKENESAKELDVIGYLFMIFRRLHLIRLKRKNTKVHYNRDIILVRKMTEYIRVHYKETIKLDDIAGSGGVSRSKCTILFKQYCAKPPVSFLSSYRLERASKLLLETDDPIAFISNECGIGEQSYFGKLFRKEFGCTPSQWRDLNGRGGKTQDKAV